MPRASNANSNGTNMSESSEFKLTAPAWVALVGYAILTVLVLVPFDMYVYDRKTSKYVKTPYNFAHRLLIVLILFFPYFLGVYSVNCMMVGRCEVWSWIVAIGTILWACLVIASAIHFQAFRLEDVAY